MADNVRRLPKERVFGCKRLLMRSRPEASRRVGCGIPTRITIAALLACHAAGANLALQVSNETAPAGGWAQVKIFAAAPTLIASGRMIVNLDPSVFGPIARVAVFSAVGDAAGVALVDGEYLDVSFNAPSASIGQLPNQPVVAITVPVLANVAAGTVSAITVSPTLTLWTDESGNTYTFPLRRVR
jgi:hypothetical protein